MNILPKKSWHVRNKDNVARVRRDEALAAEQERERKRRAELAEQEARTDLLRKKAHHLLNCDRENERALVTGKPDSSHINLFQHVEEGYTSKSGNKEYEEEKRQEKERQEKALGLLTYLGQSAAEAQTSLPWYQEAPERRREGSSTTAHTRDEKLKGKLDPLHEMEKYLQKKKGEKKHKKDKEKKKNNERKDSSSTVVASIEQLRRERLKREAVEKERAAALMDRRSREKQTPAAKETDERRLSYNSQFHPHLARKPRIQQKEHPCQGVTYKHDCR
uniref:Leukocyte receptor cluster member 1 n=1 Tax=Geotrypetes seraphini TaxID=260995 RepID=A0A6P8SCZ9_GEOSA|nr:leukocyte receptor cluster member 1 [Geotrypetes seraphini]